MFIEDKKTKIVATIGPSSDTPEIMESLIMAGVNVVRFNMKHNTIEWHEKRIDMVNEISKKIGKSIGILIDLQGPELRIETKNKESIKLKKGETIRIVSSWKEEYDLICLPYKDVFAQMSIGDEFLIDDGFIDLRVVVATEDFLEVKATEDCEIPHRKGVNLPGKVFDFSSLIDADIQKLEMATRVKVDFVALSFCRSASDIKMLRQEMEEKKLNVHVVAKIESEQALQNIDEIIGATDAVMVARGDLGIEVPIEQLANWQKTIIKKCRQNHKAVIVATQMLQSMIDNPRPTRAEATDVSNAVWDGADAVMLSGESTSGKYPLKAVEAMSRIVNFNENKVEESHFNLPKYNNTEAIISAAIQISNQHADVAAIVVFSETGYTPRVLSSFRPKKPIITITSNQKTIDILTLSYGVQSALYNLPSGEFKVNNEILNHLKEHGLIKDGQNILVIHGQNWQKAGQTNSLAILAV